MAEGCWGTKDRGKKETKHKAVAGEGDGREEGKLTAAAMTVLSLLVGENGGKSFHVGPTQSSVEATYCSMCGAF